MKTQVFAVNYKELTWLILGWGYYYLHLTRFSLDLSEKHEWMLIFIQGDSLVLSPGADGFSSASHSCHPSLHNFFVTNVSIAEF